MNKTKHYLLTVLSASMMLTLISTNAKTDDKTHDHVHTLDTVRQHNHDHRHELSGKAKQASEGLFKDTDVKDRALTDWSGSWQSVYSYLLSGDLDAVFREKAKKNPDKTFEEHKIYYQRGYKTNVEKIDINDKTITFYQQGQQLSCDYEYEGFKILTYASGKRGVRYLFTCKNGDKNVPKFVQFSDHIIEPTKSEHFHLYMGHESHEKLLQEMENWPTYYPHHLDRSGVVHEMLYH